MVVVSIIGILAAIGVPRVFGYVRASETAEVGQAAGRILASITAYADTQLKTADEVATQIDGTELTPDGSGAEITKTIPTLVLPPNANFKYVISADVASEGPLEDQAVVCITVTGTASAGVPGGKLLFSSVPTKAPGWDGLLNRTPYVNGETDLSSIEKGGHCKDDGSADDRCNDC